MEKRERAVAVLQLVMGAGLILFWVGFFTIGLAPENPPDCYFAYEHSFPLPDGVLAVGLVISSLMLYRKNPAGKSLSLVCGGGLIFLGLLDAAFNYLNGVYALSVPDLVFNAFINLACVVLGIIIFLVFREKA
jgi:hypothetical protein